MTRPLRFEHEGDAGEVTARGYERNNIFRPDGDGLLSLALLAAAIERFDRQEGGVRIPHPCSKNRTRG